jgi:hypothetical protein
LGFGSHKKNKSRREWAADMAEWLNNYTYYRTRSAFKRILDGAFISYQSMEDDYVSFRLERRGLKAAARLVRKPVFSLGAREACRFYGGLVLLATRADRSS